MNVKVRIKWSALLVGVLYVNYVAYDNFFRPQPVAHWKKISNRSPASAQEPISGPITDVPTLRPLEDYFQFDTHSGYVGYDMKVGFWTDKGKSHFQKNGQRAIEDGLKRTFEQLMEKSSEEKKTLSSAAPKFLIKEAINKFVYNLKFYKLIDVDFEIDFMFVPKNIDYASYDDQLKTNQLVNLNSKGKLLSDFDKSNNTFLQNILNANIPSTGHIYQYIGGAITIKTELLDTTWKLSKPIPNPSKNAVKGNITLRKYYKVNQPEAFDIKSLFDSQDQSTNVDFSHFNKRKKFSSQFVTVDTIYSFNLEDLIPSKERVVIHFGKLISLDKKHDNIIKRIFQIFKKSNDINTADFLISGKYENKANHYSSDLVEFKSVIKTLEYDVKKDKFINLTLSSTSTSMDNLQSLERKLKDNLLKDEAKSLVNKLQLELLLNSEKI